MPSNKILFVLIICFGIIVSVYLVSRNTDSPSLLTKNALSSNPYINIGSNTNNDWQKILTNINPGTGTTTVLTNDEQSGDQTTLTAQVARDMFSRYLLIANKSGGVTTDDATQVANDVLSTPDYTSTAGVTYSSINLNVVDATAYNTKTYAEEMKRIITNRSSQIKNNPLDILTRATKKESADELAKLDPIILEARGFIKDIMNISVPRDVQQLHLDLLNSSSNVLSDLEAMRVSFSDPVRGISGIGQYTNHLTDFQNAIIRINKYIGVN